MYKEKSWRSLLKTITWRMIATTTTFFLAILFGLELEAATALASAELILKMGLYYFHERIYLNLKFGREEISPFIVWFTGIPNSGKTSLARALHKKIIALDRKTQWLDGQNVRELIPNLGFTKDDRNRHIQRIGHLSKTLVNQNIAVIASFISPYKESRDFVRKNVQNYIEVYVDTPLEVCEMRDTNGMYEKARSGEIKNFTGISDPYEIPSNPEIVIKTDISIEENVATIVEYLSERKFI